MTLNQNLIYSKNFLMLILQFLAVIFIWHTTHLYIYSKINKIYINNTELLEQIEIAEYERLEAIEASINVDSDMRFYKFNIEDTLRLKHGENFRDALISYGIATQEVQEIINTIPKYFGKINPGQDVMVKYNYTGMYIENINDNNTLQPRMHQLLEQIDPVEIQIRLNRSEEQVTITKNQDGKFSAEISKLQTHKSIKKIHGYIQSSLYSDAVSKGVPVIVIQKMLQEYSYDIDFQRDIHPNDEFEAIFEEYMDDKSRKVKDGKLIYAALRVNGKWYKMYNYSGDFYNQDGQSIKKSLLKTPIDGARISSTFGIRRHPILGYTRAHKGVDFAAPIGTPIYAAGNGTIIFAGRSNGYGNFVSIKHNAEYSTNYAHMMKFAKGVAKGVVVKQRQIIGYVGMTGLTSGPHLHFELVHKNEKINPTKHTIHSIDKLLGGKLLEFKRIVGDIDHQMTSVRNAD